MWDVCNNIQPEKQLFLIPAIKESALRGLMMHLSNEHFAEVEILAFRARCKLDGMSYEQTVDVRTNDGSLIRLFDFMGFAVNESRLGKNKKVILCIPYIDGDIAVLDSGKPQLLESDFDPKSDAPSRLTLSAKVLEVNSDDHDILVDAGFGIIYVLWDTDQITLNAGDVIKFMTPRLDLLEILD